MSAGSYIHGYSFFRPGMSASKQAKPFSERERESCNVHLIHVMWANPLRNKHVIFFRLSPLITHLTVSIVADLDLTRTRSKFGRCVLPSSTPPKDEKRCESQDIPSVVGPQKGLSSSNCWRRCLPLLPSPRSRNRSSKELAAINAWAAGRVAVGPAIQVTIDFK